MEIEKQFFSLLEREATEGEFEVLYKNACQEYNQIQQSKLEFEAFLSQVAQQHREDDGIQIQQTLTTYCKIMNSEYPDTNIQYDHLRNTELLQEITRTYNSEKVNKLKVQLENSLNLINQVEQFQLISLSFSKDKEKNPDPAYFEEERTDDYNMMKQLRNEIQQTNVIEPNSQLIQSVIMNQLYYENTQKIQTKPVILEEKVLQHENSPDKQPISLFMEQANQSIVEFKDILVQQNQSLLNNINLFSPPQKEPQSKSGLIKSFLIKKTVGESPKPSQPFQIGPEAQKIQHQYFQTVSEQFRKLDQIIVKSTDQEDSTEILMKIWYHYILVKFFMDDLERKVKEKSFYFLKFIVSLFAIIDTSLILFIESWHYVLISKGLNEPLYKTFTDEILGYQIKFQKSLKNIRQKLKIATKSQFE